MAKKDDLKNIQEDMEAIDDAAEEVSAIEVVMDDEKKTEVVEVDVSDDEPEEDVQESEDSTEEETEPETEEAEAVPEAEEETEPDEKEEVESEEEVAEADEPEEVEEVDEVETEKSEEDEDEKKTIEEAEREAKLEKVVDEIVHKESDESMEAEDAKMMAAFSPATSRWARLKEWFARPRNRYGVIGGVLILIVALFVIPMTRFAILNSMGVRGSLSVIVLDESSSLPLKNVEVMVGESTAITNKDGKALVTDIRLGTQELKVEKLAYATHTDTTSISTGTNTIDNVKLKPTGTQYSFVLTDWLGEVPITGADVSYGENSVLSNDEGVALLTVPPTSDESFEVLITAAGYREERLEISTTSEEDTELAMVLDRPHFFISKRTGKYTVYKTDLDGSNEEEIVLGTGKETGNLQLLDMSDKRAVFLVSTREGKRNDDGSLLSGLFQIDSETGEYEKIDESESIRLYGVSQDRLIYVKVAAGTSGTNPNRQRLITYDPVSGRSIEIAGTNYFNSVNITDEAVFFAPSDLYKEEKNPYLYRVNPVTAEKTTVHAAEVWSIFRTGYSELTFDAKQDWYKVSTAKGSSPLPLDSRPTSVVSNLYQLSPSGEVAAYIDYRDSKGYLISHDVASGEDETVHVQKGMKHPLIWLSDNHILFRVSDSSGTSDYIVDLRGGDAQELVEVSDIASYDRWYYYY